MTNLEDLMQKEGALVANISSNAGPIRTIDVTLYLTVGMRRPERLDGILSLAVMRA